MFDWGRIDAVSAPWRLVRTEKPAAVSPPTGDNAVVWLFASEGGNGGRFQVRPPSRVEDRDAGALNVGLIVIQPFNVLVKENPDLMPR